MLNRRTFLGTSITAGASAAAMSTSVLCPLAARADDLRDDLRVTRIIGFDLPTRRRKMIGKNSRLDDHGITSRDRMVWIKTNAGLDGIGNCRASEKQLAQMLGSDPFAHFRAHYDPNNVSVADQRNRHGLGPSTMPLWDLAGKACGKPVYELLGGRGPQRVPVYDGSIYFIDLLAAHAARWQDRLREEIDTGLAAGHRAFKVKIGRGAKWMPRAEGDARDLEVLRLIRAHAGDDVVIGIDANNGYDPAGTRRLLNQIADLNIAFVEEMFPEDVDEYLALKEFIGTHNWPTLIADGETQGDVAALQPFMDAAAIDVYQLDMNRLGIEGILTEAALARPSGGRIAPHNWGSLVGYFMEVHVGRAIDNFYMAEHDPLESDILIADGYTITAGHAKSPDTPGFGLALDKTKFAATAKIRFDLRA